MHKNTTDPSYRCGCMASDRPCSHLHAEGHAGCQRPGAFILISDDESFHEPFCSMCGEDAIECGVFLPIKLPLTPENLWSEA